MDWNEILVGIWCLVSPAIASWWGYRAGFKACEIAEKDRTFVRNLYSSPREKSSDY